MDFRVDQIIYLQTNPEVAYERIKKRNRMEENKIPFQYVKGIKYIIISHIILVTNIFIKDLHDSVCLSNYVLLNCWTDKKCYCKNLSHLSWNCPWAHFFAKSSQKLSKNQKSIFWHDMGMIQLEHNLGT